MNISQIATRSMNRDKADLLEAEIPPLEWFGAGKVISAISYHLMGFFFLILHKSGAGPHNARMQYSLQQNE